MLVGIIRDHAAQHGRASDDGQLRINYNQAEAMVPLPSYIYPDNYPHIATP